MAKYKSGDLVWFKGMRTIVISNKFHCIDNYIILYSGGWVLTQNAIDSYNFSYNAGIDVGFIGGFVMEAKECDLFDGPIIGGKTIKLHDFIYEEDRGGLQYL